MKDLFGSPGKMSGLVLRIGQCSFAAASIGVMVSAHGFFNSTAFWYIKALYILHFRLSYQFIIHFLLGCIFYALLGWGFVLVSCCLGFVLNGELYPVSIVLRISLTIVKQHALLAGFCFTRYCECYQMFLADFRLVNL